MTVFFTSDIHFGHRLMINKERHQSANRDYATVEEMDNDIIKRWNRQVQPHDTVFLIGDVSFHKPARTLEIMYSLNGFKNLVKGNHDHRKKNHPYAQVEWAEALNEFHIYLERKFVIGGTHDQLIVMFHFPIMHWHKQHFGSWHLHGHLHGNPSGVAGKCMDVGWDKWGKLLTLDDVSEYMATRPMRGNHHEEKY